MHQALADEAVIRADIDVTIELDPMVSTDGKTNHLIGNPDYELEG